VAQQNENPDAGLKLSELDNDDADVEIEADLPPGADEELSIDMVEMMFDLEGCDEQDMEWLPPKERRKRETRQTGMISSSSMQKS
jgi:hypothetical protein